jgi:hypothetical protein
MILREEGDLWLFVGQAYVHGIMDGEAIDGLDISNHLRLFEIDQDTETSRDLSTRTALQKRGRHLQRAG